MWFISVDSRVAKRVRRAQTSGSGMLRYGHHVILTSSGPFFSCPQTKRSLRWTSTVPVSGKPAQWAQLWAGWADSGEGRGSERELSNSITRCRNRCTETGSHNTEQLPIISLEVGHGRKQLVGLFVS